MPTTYAAKKTTGRSYRISNGALSELSIPYLVETPMLAAAPGLADLTGFPESLSKPTPADMAGIPVLPSQVNLFLLDVDVSEDASGIKWMFTALYKTYSGGGGGDEKPEDTTYTSRITHGTKTIMVKSPYDLSSTPKPFLNSAGRPYADPPEIRVPIRTLTVEKRYRTRVSVAGVSGTANNASVTVDGETFAAGMATIEATCETTGDKKWPFQIRFTIEELYTPGASGNTGYKVQVLNSGWEYKDSAGKLVRAEVEDSNGKRQPAKGPVLLDADGKLLAAGAAPTSKEYVQARLAAWPSWVSA